MKLFKASCLRLFYRENEGKAFIRGCLKVVFKGFEGILESFGGYRRVFGGFRRVLKDFRGFLKYF